MAEQNVKIYLIGMEIILLVGFRNRDCESLREISKSNMAAKNVKNYLIRMKMGTRESLESLNEDSIIKLYDGQVLHNPCLQTFI